MTKESEEVLIIDTDHEEGEISDDDDEVILMQGGGTSRTSRNIDHVASQPSEWVVNYDDRGRHTVSSYKRKRHTVQQSKHYSHSAPKYQSRDNGCAVKRGTRPEVTKKSKAHSVRSIAPKKSLPKTKKLDRHQKSGRNRSRMRYSSSSSTSYKTRSSSLSSSCSGSSSSSSCSTCSSSSCRSSLSLRSQSRSRSRSQSRSRSKSRNRSQSPKHRSRRRDKKAAKGAHARGSPRSRTKCSSHRRVSDRMSPRTKLKKLAAFDSALRQAKGSKRFLSIDSTSEFKKTAPSEEKAKGNAVAKLGKAKDKPADIEENEILESEKKPKPGSLGEMLLKKKLKLLKKFTQQTKGTKVGPNSLEKKDEDDELELRLVALQTAFKFLNALDKMPKEDDAVEEYLEEDSKDDNHVIEVTDKEKVDTTAASLIPDQAKENRDVIVHPAEAKEGKTIPEDESSINDLDLQNILTTDTYLTEGKSNPEMFNLISPDSDQDPVDMDISSSSDTDVEDSVQQIDEEEGRKREKNNENNDLLLKYGERKGDGDNFQIPVEWAYMMPPPPPPDHPPNDIKNINSWCYEQNMYLQTLSSYGKEDYNEEYGQMRWGSIQNNQQPQQQQLQQQGAWDEAVLHTQCNSKKISFKDQESEKDSGHHHNYPLYYLQESNQGDVDYQSLCEENYRSRELAVDTEIGTLKDAPAQHYEAFMSAVLQQRDVGMIDSRKGNQESHAEGLGETTNPKSKVGNRPGSVLIEIRTDSVVNGKSKQEKKAEARRRRKGRMKERAKQLKANLREISAQETSGKMAKSETKGDLNNVMGGVSNLEVIDEDEDLLRAKLLIDLSRKKQTKDSSQSSLGIGNRGFEMLQSNQDSLSGVGSPMSSSSPASPASPAHLVRRVACKSALSHPVAGRVKEGSPASPSHTSLTAVSRHLHDIGGNSLDPKSRAYDLPVTSKDMSKPFKIPKIKPVIISLESDEESDGHENAISSKNVRTTSPEAGTSEQPSEVSNSIDLLLRTFRNASAAESAEKGDATPPVITKKKLAITDATPQAVRHLSRTQQAEYKWLKEQLRKKTLLKKRLQAKTKKLGSKGSENSGKEINSKLEASFEGRRPACSFEESGNLKEDREAEVWNEDKEIPDLPGLNNAQEGEHTSTSNNHSHCISTPVTQHRVVKRNSGGLEIRLHNDVATPVCSTPENVDPPHEICREKKSEDFANSEKLEPVNDSDNEEETLRALLLSSLKRKQRHKENVAHATSNVCLRGKCDRNCMCDVCMPSPKDLRVILNSDGTVSENKETLDSCEGRKVVYDIGTENGIHDGLVGVGEPEGEVKEETTERTEDDDTKSCTKEEDSNGDPEVVADEEPTDQDIFLQSDWMIIDEAEDDSDCLNSVGSSYDFVDDELRIASLQNPSINVKEKLDLDEEHMTKPSEELIDERSCKESTKLGDEIMKDESTNKGICVKNNGLVNQHLASLEQKEAVVVRNFNKSVYSPVSKSDIEIERQEERMDISEKGVFKEVLENSSGPTSNNGNYSGFVKEGGGRKKDAVEFQQEVDGPVQQSATDMLKTVAKTVIADSFSVSSIETMGKEGVKHFVSVSSEVRSDDNCISKILQKSSKMEGVLPNTNSSDSANFTAQSVKQNGNEVVPIVTELQVQDELNTRNDSTNKMENVMQKGTEKQKYHQAEVNEVQIDLIHGVESKEHKEQAHSDENKIDGLLKNKQGSGNVKRKLNKKEELAEVQKLEPEKGEHKVTELVMEKEGEQTLFRMPETQGEQVLNQVSEKHQEMVSSVMLGKQEEVVRKATEKQDVLHHVLEKQGEVLRLVPVKQEGLNCMPEKQKERVVDHMSEKEENVKKSKQMSERQGDEQNLEKDLKRQIKVFGDSKVQTLREEKFSGESAIHAQRNINKVQENAIKVEDTHTSEEIKAKQIQLLKRVETVYLLKRKGMNESVSKVSDLLHSVMKDKKEQGELSEEVRKLRHQLHYMEKLFKAKSAAVENKLSQIKQLETQLETDKSKMEQLERRGRALGKQVYGSCYCLPKVAKMVPPHDMKKSAKSSAVMNTSGSPSPKSEVSRTPVSQKSVKMQMTRNESVLGNNKNSETQFIKKLGAEEQNFKPIQVKTKNQCTGVPYVKAHGETRDSQNEIPSPRTSLLKVQIKPSSESSPTAVRSSVSVNCSLQKLDEMSELCPYDLLGRCNDDSCLYQHLRQKITSEKEETSAQQKQENGRRAVKVRAKGATGNEEGILEKGRAPENSVEKEFKQTAITFSSKVSNIISDVTQLIKKSNNRNTGFNSSDKENRKCRSDSELQNVKEVKVVLPETELLQTEPCSDSSSIQIQSEEGQLNHQHSDCSSQTMCTMDAEHSKLMANNFSILPTTPEQTTAKPDCVVSGTQILVEDKSSVGEPWIKDTEMASGILVKEAESASETIVKEIRSAKETLEKETKLVSETHDMEEVHVSYLKTDGCKNNNKARLDKVVPKRQTRAKRCASRGTNSVGRKRRKLVKESDIKHTSICNTPEGKAEVVKDVTVGGSEETVSNVIQNADTFQSGRVSRCGASVKPVHSEPSRGRSRVSRTRSKRVCNEVKPSAGARGGLKETKRGRGRGKRRSC